jgi:hypothetical protein
MSLNISELKGVNKLDAKNSDKKPDYSNYTMQAFDLEGFRENLKGRAMC